MANAIEITRYEKHRDGNGQIIGLDVWSNGPGSDEVLIGLACPEDEMGDGTVWMDGKVYSLPFGVAEILRRI